MRGEIQSGGCSAVWRDADVPTLPEWKEFRKTEPVRAVQMPVAFRVKTLEGTVDGQPGDWLCLGAAGELWPIKDAIFKRTYQEVR